jgi:hypothetical protein
MLGRSSFDYAVIRVVPRVERGERINAGVILYCRARDFLAARIVLDRTRLRAIDPTVDMEEVERALGLIPLLCAGDERAGELAHLGPSERFHWVTAPRSTIVQASHVHPGLCEEPGEALEALLAKMVLPVASAPPR